ncbi:MAG: hypothetical protein DRO99_04270 [Candidatus Aenigmatarchaeota archaeon]|nr:MAG: hypothetical protein DRO99_04270 [Candidatus Aenigmarchaeota archaeon]
MDMKKGMKGQFFIVGAILVCSMLFVAYPRFAPLIREPGGDIPYISANIQRELPRVMNLGVNESAMIASMSNFTAFLERSLSEKRINYTSLVVMFRNVTTGSDGLNITVINELGSNVTLTITISGEDYGTIVASYPDLEDGSVNTSSYIPVSNINNVTVAFGSQERTMEWPRDKASIYAFFRLTRDEDIIKNDVAG